MEFNLKNRSFKHLEGKDSTQLEPNQISWFSTQVKEWFEGFEKELRKILKETYAAESVNLKLQGHKLIEEILGDSEVV